MEFMAKIEVKFIHWKTSKHLNQKNSVDFPTKLFCGTDE